MPAVKRSLGGTINDVVLAMVAGVVRSFLQARHVPLEGMEVRLSMPVNTRPEAERGTLGNRVGVVTIRELGGGRFAQALAAVSVIVGPVYLLFGNLLAMNAFEPFFWIACAWLLVRILKTNDVRLRLPIGGTCGVGLLNKYTMALFAHRPYKRRKWS